MSKVIVVPDSHGTEHWKRVKPHVEREDIDKIIFLGDYWDSFTKGYNAQLSNFNQIIRFKKRFPEKIELLWGNHETSYYHDERCSGFQHHHSFDIQEILRIYKNFFEIVFIIDNWIFSHGGVSGDWMRRTALKHPSEINQLFKERPAYFAWVGPDSSGNNQYEGPLWIRPGALREFALADWNFCVGHTELREEVKKPVWLEHKTGKILLTDSGKHNCIFELDTITNEVNLLSKEFKI